MTTRSFLSRRQEMHVPHYKIPRLSVHIPPKPFRPPRQQIFRGLVPLETGISVFPIRLPEHPERDGGGASDVDGHVDPAVSFSFGECTMRRVRSQVDIDAQSACRLFVPKISRFGEVIRFPGKIAVGIPDLDDDGTELGRIQYIFKLRLFLRLQ